LEKGTVSSSTFTKGSVMTWASEETELYAGSAKLTVGGEAGSKTPLVDS